MQLLRELKDLALGNAAQQPDQDQIVLDTQKVKEIFMKNGFSGYENLGEIENINKELQSNNGSPSLIKYPTTLSSVPK